MVGYVLPSLPVQLITDFSHLTHPDWFDLRDVVNVKDIISTHISDLIAGPSDDFHCSVCLNVMVLDS